jgi:DNA-binding MarR family transcriptional regulator
MVGKYALSLFDTESIASIEIFLGKLPKVKKLFIISTRSQKVENSEKELIDFSRHLDIKIEIVPIEDINNFFEVYLILEKICETEGFPSWVNIVNGSGMALSALTLHAFFKNALLVIFDKYSGRLITTDINKLKKIKIYKNRYFDLIRALSVKNMTTLELARLFELSTSAMSRRLQHMEMLDIITRKGSGRANFPYIYQLSDFGKRLL